MQNFVIRLKALGIQFNPIDGCQCSSELSAQLNLTNDQKRRKPHLQACPVPRILMLQLSVKLSWAKLEKRLLSWLPAMQKATGGIKWRGQAPRHTVQHIDIDG